MAPFNPLLQSVTFVSPSKVPISIPITTVDAFNDESISISINYAFQLGACTILLLVLLILTPPSKLRRVPTILHIAGLVTCIIRLALLLTFFLSPFNHFYQFWSGDYSSVSKHYFYNSVAGNVFSLVVVIVLETALIHQAWTMVTLWPTVVRVSLSVVSGVVSLMAIGWRFAFAVIQSKSDIDLVPARNLAWVVESALILNALSMCWYCTLFNVKLVMHLFANRGILKSRPTLTPMEVLVMTNGVLMFVPVIFAGLEWGHFPNFEAASLTQTSVALILPLGTLAAQQMTGGGSMRYISGSNKSDSSCSNKEKVGSPITPGGFSGVRTTCGSGTRLQGPMLSNGTVGGRRAKMDHFDLELRQIDSTSALAEDRVRVDMDLEQKETRI